MTLTPGKVSPCNIVAVTVSWYSTHNVKTLLYSIVYTRKKGKWENNMADCSSQPDRTLLRDLGTLYGLSVWGTLGRATDRQIDRQIDRQTDRQTEKQTA